jgi:hypothetical protein
MAQGVKALNKQTVIEDTRRWIDSIVIGLNLCPFAQRVFKTDRIRYAVSEAETAQELLGDLARELEYLAVTPITSVETTLLIHPRALVDFPDYNDFLDCGEQLIEELGLRGTIQLASFHPDYQFAGADVGAVENYTNRSPYAMLHLLREVSISQVAGDPNELLEIPRRNVETLRSIGKENMLEKLKAIQDG